MGSHLHTHLLDFEDDTHLSQPILLTRICQNPYPKARPQTYADSYTPVLTSASPIMPSYQPIPLPECIRPASVQATTAGVGHWQNIASYLHSILIKKELYKVLLSQAGG